MRAFVCLGPWTAYSAHLDGFGRNGPYVARGGVAYDRRFGVRNGFHGHQSEGSRCPATDGPRVWRQSAVDASETGVPKPTAVPSATVAGSCRPEPRTLSPAFVPE